MSWKFSLVIIEEKDNNKQDDELIEVIYGQDYEKLEELSLDASLTSVNSSDIIYIGRYNSNIIICDNNTIIDRSLDFDKTNKTTLSKQERKLCKLFPVSEILSVACNEAVDYHGYSLIQNGKKVRLKIILDEKIEFGKTLVEEDQIYRKAKRNGKYYYWLDENSTNNYSENQMMLEFTFSLINRRIGVNLDESELFFDTVFQKYKLKTKAENNKPKTLNRQIETTKTEKQKHIKTIIVVMIVYLLWKIIENLF